MSEKDLLIAYKNYLYAIMWAKEYGNKYLDEDVLPIFEEDLKKVLVKESKYE